MTSLPGCAVDIDHNPYLPAGGRQIEAAGGDDNGGRK